MSQYLGSKIADAVKLPCTAPALNDVLAVDPADPKKGVWQKAGTDNIANLAINTSKLADSAVAATKLADGAVTTTKIDAGAITSAKFAAGAVDTTALGSGAVTSAKLNAGAVDATAIATGAVTSTKLADGAATTAKLATDAVTAAKVASKALSSEHLTDDIVQGHGLLNKFLGATNPADDAPAGFNMVGGAVFNTHILKETTNHRAGANALTFAANCPTSYGFESELTPVREGELVEGLFGFRASGTNVAALAVLVFYQRDKSTLVGTETDIFRGAAAAAATEYTKRVALAVPNDARFVKTKVTLTVQHATETFTVDTLNIVTTPFGGFTGIMPIGSIVAWDKSLSGMPALPAGWVQCDGQTLSDKDSPLDGQLIRNLNGVSGTKRFLRGDTTSGTFSNSNLAPHSHTMNHGHTLDTDAGGVSIFTNPQVTSNNTNTAVAGIVNDFSGSTGSTGSDDTYPAHMTVVWIMRVK